MADIPIRTTQSRRSDHIADHNQLHSLHNQLLGTEPVDDALIQKLVDAGIAEGDSIEAVATAISFTPTGTISATDVQSAIAEVSSETVTALNGKMSTTGGGEEAVQIISSASGAQALDLSDANVFDITMTGDCSFTFSGATDGKGCSFTLILRQGSGGGGDGHNVTSWPDGITWLGTGFEPELQDSVDAINVVSFYTSDGGESYLGFYQDILSDAAADTPSLRSLGTTSTTAAAGNDSRITGAIQSIYAPFSATGALTTTTGTQRFYVEAAHTIVGVRASVGTAPTGGTVTVDVLKNGSTIFTGTPLVIAAGTNTDTSGTPTTTALASGDYLTVSYTVTGSNAANLTVQVQLNKA